MLFKDHGMNDGVTDDQHAAIPPQPSFEVTRDHPALAGHFPGRPLLPGVLLLDHALRFLKMDQAPVHIASARFSMPVLPGDRVDISTQAATNGESTIILSTESGVSLKARVQAMHPTPPQEGMGHV
ncbi:AMP-(fatty)acid ligase [Granulibacter bethesdensis]|uniref:AMP-(Fatty)acid ligase n=2 Tax=Granulibacter bethesdensis TaxID=364410 RepID=Q0BW68_GRABC|nr:AMP-(fatty)acid ligase [Granulibacter bethesdensis CGDNIH1]AHJ67018.1 AMP-(fatty)acid ligase [Granulibacter bethesdensis]APH50699.1 AMP-(fatty)acid ligase [Granulibacter bethesdensis]APH58318.1 AMP-(fatty)acid ligase [Granulibacter bethesdensis]APH63394.1 AMP-(fatty)acid ligase [Granulibacter bethesdensis]